MRCRGRRHCGFGGGAAPRPRWRRRGRNRCGCHSRCPRPGLRSFAGTAAATLRPATSSMMTSSRPMLLPDASASVAEARSPRRQGASACPRPRAPVPWKQARTAGGLPSAPHSATCTWWTRRAETFAGCQHGEGSIAELAWSAGLKHAGWRGPEPVTSFGSRSRLRFATVDNLRPTSWRSLTGASVTPPGLHPGRQIPGLPVQPQL